MNYLLASQKGLRCMEKVGCVASHGNRNDSHCSQIQIMTTSF